MAVGKEIRTQIGASKYAERSPVRWKWLPRVRCVKRKNEWLLRALSRQNSISVLQHLANAILNTRHLYADREVKRVGYIVCLLIVVYVVA